MNTSKPKDETKRTLCWTPGYTPTPKEETEAHKQIDEFIESIRRKKANKRSSSK